MGRRLIEAGSGKRRPITTEQIRNSSIYGTAGPDWLRTLQVRFGTHLSNRVTRAEISELYEEAYSELAEEHNDLRQKVSELESDNRSHTAAIQDLLKRKKDLERRLGQTGRRLWSVLDLLEKRFYDQFPDVSGMEGETDYYFDGVSMYED